MLERKVVKKRQPPRSPPAIATSSSSKPAARAAARPLPTPNQPGTIWRLWVQPKTHGMARSPAMPPPESGRRAGREPGGSSAGSSGVGRPPGGGAGVKRGERRAGGRGEEVVGQQRVLDQRAVAGEGGALDRVH